MLHRQGGQELRPVTRMHFEIGSDCAVPSNNKFREGFAGVASDVERRHSKCNRQQIEKEKKPQLTAAGVSTDVPDIIGTEQAKPEGD